MKKRHVLLIGEKQLLGESLESLLNGVGDIHLSGPKPLNDELGAHISEINPEVILIAENEYQTELVSQMAASILEQYPRITVIHCTLSRNVVRVYSSQELPARTADLIDAIRSHSTEIK